MSANCILTQRTIHSEQLLKLRCNLFSSQLKCVRVGHNRAEERKQLVVDEFLSVGTLSILRSDQTNKQTNKQQTNKTMRQTKP